MSTELTFKWVCDKVKVYEKDDPALLQAVDSLLGLTLICSATVDPSLIVLLPFLSVKNELTKIGKQVLDKVTKKEERDYLARYEAMSAAYGLIVFTSFFDALDECLSDDLRKEIGLLASEKQYLVQQALERAADRQSEEDDCKENGSSANTPFTFPHPTESINDQILRLHKVWTEMARGFDEFIQKLRIYEEADDEKISRLNRGLEKLVNSSEKLYAAQYFELARKYEDFAVWANLQESKQVRKAISELGDNFQRFAELSQASSKNIDIGFENLRKLVTELPQVSRSQQGSEIAKSLHREYQSQINKPIFEDKELGDEDATRLRFPKVSEAFIPQAFKVLRQESFQSRRLEHEVTWSQLPRRNDLGTFLVSYLLSPYSTETPLLILGHPGSGKSLLTKILSTQLMSDHFTIIRIPLRDVNAELDIQGQIEDYLRRISGVSQDSWIKLRSHFAECPPVVVLDGYDELLQASGQVLPSYITDTQRFQEQQNTQDCPIRIIITSRVTLIDKAAVPKGATILQLMEFDEEQQDRWTKKWNETNAASFRDYNLKPFQLPSSKDKRNEKILELAKQPLLLLMLALYDSQANELAGATELDRTNLYYSLIKRFVTRERQKETAFMDAAPKQQREILDREIKRLGVVALGMYNRRKVHIHSDELERDLVFFSELLGADLINTDPDIKSKTGKRLSQAELLLGSFIFVYQSKALDAGNEQSSAFEFLHNTFGEFLVADFIIRITINQANTWRSADSAEKKRMERVGLNPSWFACLIYTPLFTRPVVLEMIREWTPHVLKGNSLSIDDFIEPLNEIIQTQTKRLLCGMDMPQMMRSDKVEGSIIVPYANHPLVGHLAIYSMNLILLRIVSDSEPFEFSASEIGSHEDGTHPWDQLINIWRSWFSISNLNGLAAIMMVRRNAEKVLINAKSKFSIKQAPERLSEVLRVALALGDNLSAAITGVYSFDPCTGSLEELETLESMAESDQLDLGIQAKVMRLRTLAKRFRLASDEFMILFSRTVSQAVFQGRRDVTEQICELLCRVFEGVSSQSDQIANHCGTFYL